MNDSNLAEVAERPVAAARCWPHAEKSERRAAEELFDRLRNDVHADDELITLLASENPREKLIAVLAVMRLAIFTPHRWSPDERTGAEKDSQRKGGRHVEVLAALEALYGDPSLPPKLLAATVLAIGEIERQLVATRKRKLLFIGGLDPHVIHLLRWLKPEEPERCEAALWALSLIAPLNSTPTVQTTCDSIAVLFGRTENVALWAAAAKLATGFHKRGRELEPVLLKRLKAGAGEAGCEIIEALFSFGQTPTDLEAIVTALDALLRTTSDPRRLWLCVLRAASIDRERFLEPLKQIAATNEGPAAKAAQEVLAATNKGRTIPPSVAPTTETGVRELSCVSA